MGTSSQFRYGVQLNILPTLSSEILNICEGLQLPFKQ